MAGRGSRSAQQARTQAERARAHAARSAWHDGQIRRRVRDNTIAGVVGGLIVVAAIGSQFVHAQMTAPEPTPEPTSTVEPTDAPLPVPTTTTAPEPSPSETPAE